MTENESKQLAKIREKIAQMRAKEQAIIAKDKHRQRKERTRRLIQLGTIAEKHLNCTGIEPAEFEILMQEIIAKSKLPKN